MSSKNKKCETIESAADIDELSYSDVNLAQFISDEYSICREERQYALYLYNLINKLRYTKSFDWIADSEIIEVSKNKKISLKKSAEDIVNNCGLNQITGDILKDIDIQGVYYEATFMRDIFERLRRIDCYKSLNRNEKNNLLYKKCDIDIDYYSYPITHEEIGKSENKQAEVATGVIRNAQEFNQRLIEFIMDKLNAKSAEIMDNCKSDIIKVYEENKNNVRPVNLGHNKIFIEDENKYCAAKEAFFAAKKKGLEKADNKAYKKLKDAYDKAKEESNKGLDYIHYIAQCMMNAKPDIAIIYEEEGKVKLRFIECKFESGEGKYKNNISQLQIQNYIGEFLQKYYGIKYVDTIKVEFSRKRLDGKIMISDMIKINELIMK